MEVYYLKAAARQPDRSGSFAESNDCFERQGRTPGHGRSATVEPERERFDRHRSQFDPIRPVAF
jgi:hypothetical protein